MARQNKAVVKTYIVRSGSEYVTAIRGTRLDVGSAGTEIYLGQLLVGVVYAGPGVTIALEG